MLDILIARMIHVEWIHQLKRALDESSTVVSLRSHSDCELGTWLYRKGLRVYSHIPEIELLEESHKAFHDAAEKVRKWHNGAKLNPQPEEAAQARLAYEEALKMSKEIVYHLTNLELEILRQHEESERRHTLEDIILHPFRTLKALSDSKESKLNIPQVWLDVLKEDLQRMDFRKL